VIQDMLANHVVELLQATVAEGKITWPGPIALELVAEAEAQWPPAELKARPAPNKPLLQLPMVINNRSRLAASDRPASDLQILLTVSNSATLFLDRQLNITRFTPRVGELFNVLPSDQGQPLTLLAHRLGFAGLVDDALAVLASLVHLERQIRIEQDQWFLARLQPYRSVDNQIDGVVITFLDITRLKETEAKLHQSQQQIESLTEQLETVVAEQRERVRQLASEVLITEQKVQSSVSQLLHDELQQILFSIQMQVEILHQQLPAGEQALQAQMRELREAANLAFDVTRQVAVDLKPPVLLNEDFMQSLHWLAATMTKRYGLKVALKGTLRPGWPGQEVSILLFQTVRELLFNVVKHASVTEAQVEVAAEANHLRLMVEVSDAGRGFDVAAVMAQRPDSGGMGLVSIRNRLELLGGQFHIESQPGRGARATIVVLV
jgi:two-component system, chemotaxis family, CheB/CheR fusion protein